MHQMFTVMNTDQINRQNLRIPVQALADAIENAVAAGIRRGLPAGTPSNISHDANRLIGWSVGTELHLGADMARHVGDLYLFDDESEQMALRQLADRYWSAHDADGTEPWRAELEARLAGVALEGGYFMRTEAASVVRRGLAAELYPSLFRPGEAGVDKDGLVETQTLLGRLKEVANGVFHDPDRDLILFAHPYFRRGLSRRNSLNLDFLALFRETADDAATTSRLKLDPDMIGHPSSVRRPIELDYWRGPRFDDDISAIPSGVAEHKATNTQRLLEGVDKTQIWWKSPETRTLEGGAKTYRTFECEELVEHPIEGLQDGAYGCRYAHAEYRADTGVFSHFDGAIRAYAGEAYLERIEQSIDRAGKRSDYTKLFRFDGALTVAAWKRLLAGFYRGNVLIPEYLGDLHDTTPPVDAEEVSPVRTKGLPSLSALVSFASHWDLGGLNILAETSTSIGVEELELIDTGAGAVAAWVARQCPNSLNQARSIFQDGILNLSPLAIGPDRLADWSTLLTGLAEAFGEEADEGSVRLASCALVWDTPICGMRLSIAGRVDAVAGLLAASATIIEPTSSSSTWIEALNQTLKRQAPVEDLDIDWNEVRPNAGRLQVPHPDGTVFSFVVPESQMTPELQSAINATILANEAGEASKNLAELPVQL